MKITAAEQVIWSHSAKAHRIEKGYSARYVEAIIRNPQEVRRQGADLWIVYGYGHGAVVAKKSTCYLVVACFIDGGQAKYPAAA